MLKIIPVLTVLPSLIGSFFNYFTTDHEKSAFQLPVPGRWYARKKNVFSVLCSVVCLNFMVNHNFVSSLNSIQWKRYPFDWKRPSGYLIVSAIEYLSTLTIIYAVVCIIYFQVGSVIVLNLLTKDIKYNVDDVNEKAKVAENQLELVKQCNELIQFHSNSIQLSYNYYKCKISVCQKNWNRFNFCL